MAGERRTQEEARSKIASSLFRGPEPADSLWRGDRRAQQRGRNIGQFRSIPGSTVDRGLRLCGWAIALSPADGPDHGSCLGRSGSQFPLARAAVPPNMVISAAEESSWAIGRRTRCCITVRSSRWRSGSGDTSRAIREAGCKVPTSAMIDSLDPAEIELWFADRAFNIHRLENAIRLLADSSEESDRDS